MAGSISINVRNNSATVQSFFFFQQPAFPIGQGAYYSNSLFTRALLPFATSGGILTFSTSTQIYAGVQQQLDTLIVGARSGELTASQPIEVTTTGGQANNTTTMMVSPSLGLSTPVNTSGPPVGCFRIITPVFNPLLNTFNGGLAMQAKAGSIVLSSFANLPPNIALDCQPVLKFYVQTGNYPAGTVVDFKSASSTAALCDATPGYSTFEVVYNLDGTWTVTPYAARAKSLG
ncbi:MAG TPA: hypothetical protein VMF12_20695 [Xanthobacteraceae bacterium]|nr:hypothetical protein [Xanthobacteraceae bacterium]